MGMEVQRTSFLEDGMESKRPISKKKKDKMSQAENNNTSNKNLG
jgi:hypothetical protein